MSDPLRLVAAAAELGVSYAGRRQVRRDLRQILWGAIAGGAATIATGFIFAAIWLFVRPAIGAAAAALVMAGLLLLIALAAAVACRLVVNTRRPVAGNPEQMDALLADAAKLIQKHKAGLLLAALLAGILTGDGRRNTRFR
jgi:hypothetical protein